MWSTLRKLLFHFLSNWMGYDRGDNFPPYFEPNGIPFGSKSKGKVSPRSYPIQCERKWNTKFLSVAPQKRQDEVGISVNVRLSECIYTHIYTCVWDSVTPADISTIYNRLNILSPQNNKNNMHKRMALTIVSISFNMIHWIFRIFLYIPTILKFIYWLNLLTAFNGFFPLKDTIIYLLYNYFSHTIQHIPHHPWKPDQNWGGLHILNWDRVHSFIYIYICLNDIFWFGDEFYVSYWQLFV